MKKITCATLLLLQFCAILFSSKLSANGADKKYLFILFDAGEYFALSPVIDNLYKNGAHCQVLVSGCAQELVKHKRYDVINLSAYAGATIDSSWPREKEINAQKAQEIAAHFLYSHTTCVVSGVSSKLQEQLLEAFSAKQIKTIAYWDNFNAEGQDSYFQVAQKVQKKANELFVPSEYVKNAAVFKERNPKTIHVVGQPALEVWTNDVLQNKSNSSLVALKNNAGALSRTKTFAIIGGYGEKYEQSFRLMVQCLERTATQMPVQVIVQPHPKVIDGKFERDELRKSRLLAPLVITPESGISTKDVVAYSDGILCYNSTVGFQALGCKKNVYFVVPKDDLYTNLAIDLKIAKKITSADEFMAALDTRGQMPDLFTILGIPQNSIKTMLIELDAPMPAY